MKWENDPHQMIKHTIFDIIRKDLPEDLAAKITIRQLTDAIDYMMRELLKGIPKG
jgi:hypothetical protein